MGKQLGTWKIDWEVESSTGKLEAQQNFNYSPNGISENSIRIGRIGPYKRVQGKS